MALWPSFHSPRSFKTLTRSKRFMTERLPVAPPLRLSELCFDIVESWNGWRKLGRSCGFGKDELGINFQKRAGYYES